MTTAGNRQFAFSGYRLDVRARELSGPDGAVVPLTSKALDVLLHLIEHRDRVLAKDELLTAAWPGRVVEENNLPQAISALRRALGGDAGDHRFIVTVPGRGYRFVADVREEHGAPADAGPPAQPATPMPRAHPTRDPRASGPLSRRALWLGALLFLATLLAVSAWRMLAPAPAAAPAVAATPVALAVLPFRPLSEPPHDTLLGLGLADTLVTRLGRSPGLRVRTLASARRLAGGEDAAAVARTLGATHVVEGSTQRRDGQLRVNARLLSADDGRVLWSDTFDTRADRVFTVQDRIGDAVIQALALQPLAATARPSSPCDGGDAQAYRAVLNAQYRLHRRDPRTIAAFHDAIAQDPTCSRAYAGLAVAYMFMAHNDAAPREVFPLARAAIDRALQLDPDAPEALVAHGRYLQLHAWNWRASEGTLRRAIAQAPSLSEARFALAHLLVTTGRFDEGLRQAAQARELDPLSPFVNALEAGFLTAAGREAQARARVERALELEPDFWVALLVRGGMALDRGDLPAALADLERAAAQSQRTSQVLAVLAEAHAAAGHRAQAEAIERELRLRARTRYVPPINRAAVRHALGDRDGALDLLEQARAARDIRMAFMQVDARWNGLRTDPRFRRLARGLGLDGGPARGRF